MVGGADSRGAWISVFLFHHGSDYQIRMERRVFIGCNNRDSGDCIASGAGAACCGSIIGRTAGGAEKLWQGAAAIYRRFGIGGTSVAAGTDMAFGSDTAAALSDSVELIKGREKHHGIKRKEKGLNRSVCYLDAEMDKSVLLISQKPPDAP